FVAAALPVLKEHGAIPEQLTDEERERLTKILSLLQTRVGTLKELPAQVGYFFADSVTYDEKAVRKFFTREYVPTLFELLLNAFVDLEPFDEERIEPIFEGLREELGLKLGDVIQPVRVAVTGSTVSPPMYD